MKDLEISEDLLQPLNDSQRDAEEISTLSRSYWSEVWNRLKKDRVAMFGGGAIVFLLLIALFVPMVVDFDYSDDNLEMVNIPPLMKSWVGSNGNSYFVNKDYRVYLVSHGRLSLQLPKKAEDIVKSRMFFGEKHEFILDYSDKKNILYIDAEGKPLRPGKLVWNRQNLLGTDIFGRDLFIRIVYGARISLTVAFIAALVNLFIGTIYGGISGYLGGRVDNIMMRIVDIINTIPLTLYVILIMVFVGSGIRSIIIALSSVYWVGMARLVRGQVLSIKEEEFVLAAKTMGTSGADILFRHLLPNAMGPIVVSLTMLIPKAIFVEAFLSYIGLGVPRPMASWGTLCNDAIQTLNMFPHQLIAPALAISVTMFTFSFLGDGLRDALDPRLRK